jgi:5-hydroxyisourate hydrolase
MEIVVQVVDGMHGRPAAGLKAVLYREVDGCWQECGHGSTDADGLVADWGDAPVVRGVHRLVFDLGTYFAPLGVEPFFPWVAVTFRVADPVERYEMPLMVTPHFFSAGHQDRPGGGPG